ncbi:snRNA-activating protein complex subunit [Anaeramoeba flamelloides]|uniref:snRNA-activating protein complex subunit n=1 Tax=Anaeramoeba flamelloides TaxID=1746091 RepID=A0AAV7Y3S5_9EUKA|nr:snRNA-activating protein complex subunit [Anaeramoeba flamelloides]
MMRSINEGSKQYNTSTLFEKELEKEEKQMDRWAQKDDEYLIQLVKEDNKTNWDLISQNFKNFDATMCLKRYRTLKSIQTKKGMWIKIEDTLLKNAINLFGETNWAQVSAFIPGRNSKQCRERWNNQLNPNINRSPFTIEEGELLIQKQKEIGNKWSTIAQFFDRRTDNMLKNHWHSLRVRKGLPNYYSPKNKNNKRRKNARKKKKITIGAKDNLKKTENEFSFGFERIKKNKKKKNISKKGLNFKKKFNKDALKIEIQDNSQSIFTGKQIKNKKLNSLKLTKLTIVDQNENYQNHNGNNINQLYFQNLNYGNGRESPISPREHTNSPTSNAIRDVSSKIRKLNLCQQNSPRSPRCIQSPLSARSPRSHKTKNFFLSPRSTRTTKCTHFKKNKPSKKKKRKKKKKKKFLFENQNINKDDCKYEYDQPLTNEIKQNLNDEKNNDDIGVIDDEGCKLNSIIPNVNSFKGEVKIQKTQIYNIINNQKVNTQKNNERLNHNNKRQFENNNLIDFEEINNSDTKDLPNINTFEGTENDFITLSQNLNQYEDFSIDAQESFQDLNYDPFFEIPLNLEFDTPSINERYEPIFEDTHFNSVLFSNNFDENIIESTNWNN